MTIDSFSIHFNYNNVYYDGRVSPESIDETGEPAAYEVFLNNVYFGYISRNGKQWQVNEQRPETLVELVGACIENNRKLKEV